MEEQASKSAEDGHHSWARNFWNFYKKMSTVWKPRKNFNNDGCENHNCLITIYYYNKLDLITTDFGQYVCGLIL